MLSKIYTDDFERLWKVYPKWPLGRSKKEPSFQAFSRAKKILQFTASDIAAIELDIIERIAKCETWQRANKYGPVMFATYMNQHLWNEPYQKVRGASHKPQERLVDEETNKRLWAQAEHAAGREVPVSYEQYLSH